MAVQLIRWTLFRFDHGPQSTRVVGLHLMSLDIHISPLGTTCEIITAHSGVSIASHTA
jgi:hypothetical protein